MHPIAYTVIRWLGQACFLITTLAGSHLLIDPPHPEIGYHIAAHSIPADVVFVSHNHPDHNFVDAAEGHPFIVQPSGNIKQSVAENTQGNVTYSGNFIDSGTSKSKEYSFQRIFAYHDNVHGAKRGFDTITVLHTGGLSICHLGDLGQLALTPNQIHEIGHVDILMIPVGGFFTIDGTNAAKIVAQLHPHVILPMHYQTPALSADIKSKLAPPDAFLAAMQGHAKIVHIGARDLNLSPSTLPKTPTIYLLRYE